jgi:hypothetical protein
MATGLEPICTNVTFDIIGQVVTNIDCKAQDDSVQEDDMVKNFRILSATYAGDNGLSFTWLNLAMQLRRYVYSKRLDAVSGCSLHTKHVLTASPAI